MAFQNLLGYLIPKFDSFVNVSNLNDANIICIELEKERCR